MRAFYAQESGFDLLTLVNELDYKTSLLQVQALRLRLGRAENLAVRDLGPVADVDDILKAMDIQSAQARAHEQTAERLLVALKDVRSRRIELMSIYDGPVYVELPASGHQELLLGWKASLTVQDLRLEELSLLRESCTVRAPMAGRVTEIQAQPGKILLTGTPMIVVTNPLVREVEL
ncbi:MAG: multidrug efflux pump subunit AcrA (membrane-fusion protein) [Planctomycetota bacterium]